MLGLEALESRFGRVDRPACFASVTFRGEGCSARFLRGLAATLHLGERPIAFGRRCFDPILESRKVLGQLGKTIGTKQPFGGRCTCTGGDKPIPAPQYPAASHQSLTDSERLSPVLVDDSDLPQPAEQLRRRGYMIGEAFRSIRQSGIAGKHVTSLPPPRTVASDCRIGVLAERSGKGSFIAMPRLEARDCGTPGMFKCTRKRVMF
jgi:hypothetical protein